MDSRATYTEIQGLDVLYFSRHEQGHMQQTSLKVRATDVKTRFEFGLGRYCRSVGDDFEKQHVQTRVDDRKGRFGEVFCREIHIANHTREVMNICQGADDIVKTKW